MHSEKYCYIGSKCLTHFIFAAKKAQKIYFLSFKTGEKSFWRHNSDFFFMSRKVGIFPTVLGPEAQTILNSTSSSFFSGLYSCERSLQKILHIS